MQLTDTHTHPYYADDAAEFVRRAVDAGVTRMILPNVDVDSIGPMNRLAKTFPDNLRMAIGLHPTEVNENAAENLKTILQELEKKDSYVAVGEIGIDLYWDKTFRDLQMEMFERQLSVAEAKNLPVIIHCREALDEVLEVLTPFRSLKRVFHSFGGDIGDVERILASGDESYFGINGIVTFKNSSLRQVVPSIPSDRLLLETDSPYLAPVPHRGKPNESAYLVHIARTVADALNKDIEEVAGITSANSLALFGF